MDTSSPGVRLSYAHGTSATPLLFHGRGFRQNLYQPMFDDVRPRCSALRHVFRLDEDWDSFLRSGEGVPDAELGKRESSLQFDDPINIQYTSGTTGFPKGATLT